MLTPVCLPRRNAYPALVYYTGTLVLTATPARALVLTATPQRRMLTPTSPVLVLTATPARLLGAHRHAFGAGLLPQTSTVSGAPVTPSAPVC
jgi:hypothetical protein